MAERKMSGKKTQPSPRPGSPPKSPHILEAIDEVWLGSPASRPSSPVANENPKDTKATGAVESAPEKNADLVAQKLEFAEKQNSEDVVNGIPAGGMTIEEEEEPVETPVGMDEKPVMEAVGDVDDAAFTGGIEQMEVEAEDEEGDGDVIPEESHQGGGLKKILRRVAIPAAAVVCAMLFAAVKLR